MIIYIRNKVFTCTSVEVSRFHFAIFYYKLVCLKKILHQLKRKTFFLFYFLPFFTKQIAYKCDLEMKFARKSDSKRAIKTITFKSTEAISLKNIIIINK